LREVLLLEDVTMGPEVAPGVDAGVAAAPVAAAAAGGVGVAAGDVGVAAAPVAAAAAAGGVGVGVAGVLGVAAAPVASAAAAGVGVAAAAAPVAAAGDVGVAGVLGVAAAPVAVAAGGGVGVAGVGVDAAPVAATAAAPAAAGVGAARGRRWVKIDNPPKVFGMQTSKHTDASDPNDLAKMYLRLDGLTVDGFAEKFLKLNIGDRIYGYGEGNNKSTLLSPDAILEHIERSLVNYNSDKDAVNANLNARKQARLVTGGKLKRRTDPENKALKATFKFKPYTLCVSKANAAVGPEDAQSNFSGNEMEKLRLYRDTLKHYVAHGYTQVRLVSLAATDFDRIVYDCVSFPLNAEELRVIMTRCLIICCQYGFHVCVWICDGASCNRKLWRNVFTGVNPLGDDPGAMQSYFPHPVTQKPVFFLPDSSHVIKKLGSSLDNENHDIKLLNDDTNEDCAISMKTFCDLWQSFGTDGCPSTFRFHLSDFIKTSLEKKRVGPVERVLCGHMMLDMLSEGIRRAEEYASIVDKNSVEAKRLEKWADVKRFYMPTFVMVTKLRSVFSILNRKSMPGLSSKPSHVHELSIFDEVRTWFLKWRQDSFKRAEDKTWVESGQALGIIKKHEFFFTQEASDDFLLMLTVIPQLVKTYAIQHSPEQWTYILPSHLTTDPLENRFAKIKLGVGHNILGATNVIRVANEIEVCDVNKSTGQHKRKSNSGEHGVNGGVIVAPNVNNDDEEHQRQKAKLCKDQFTPFDVLREEIARQDGLRMDLLSQYEHGVVQGRIVFVRH
jgi:hypothetical protein